MTHDHPVLTTGSSITDMEAMWVLMVIMFGWNLWMAYQHYKLQNKVECKCGGKK